MGMFLICRADTYRKTAHHGLRRAFSVETSLLKTTAIVACDDCRFTDVVAPKYSGTKDCKRPSFPSLPPLLVVPCAPLCLQTHDTEPAGNWSGVSGPRTAMVAERVTRDASPRQSTLTVQFPVVWNVGAGVDSSATPRNPPSNLR